MTVTSEARSSRRVPTWTPRYVLGHVADARRVLAEWQRRRLYRRDLRRLLCVGAYMIDDIGLTLGDAQRESVKSFWQA